MIWIILAGVWVLMGLWSFRCVYKDQPWVAGLPVWVELTWLAMICIGMGPLFAIPLLMAIIADSCIQKRFDEGNK